MENKLYSEKEKDFCIKNALHENNLLLFNMIKEHIEELVITTCLQFKRETLLLMGKDYPYNDVKEIHPL